MKWLCSFAFMALVALAGGWQNGVVVSPQGDDRTGVELTSAQIADRVEAALSAPTKYLEAEVNISRYLLNTANGQTVPKAGPSGNCLGSILVRFKCAENAFQTIVWERGNDGGIIGPTKGVSLFDGKVQELHPRVGGEGFQQYDPPHLNGIDSMMVRSDIDCLTGALIFSWINPASKVGPDVSAPRFSNQLRNGILNGKRQGDVVVAGQDCYMFLREINIKEIGHVVEDYFYFSKKTFLPVRWETRQKADDGTEVYHDEQYTIKVAAEVPQNTNWRLWAFSWRHGIFLAPEFTQK